MCYSSSKKLCALDFNYITSQMVYDTCMLRRSPVFVCVLQVGNLGLLFMLLFFIYAALGVELFGELGKCASHTPTEDYVTNKSSTCAL